VRIAAAEVVPYALPFRERYVSATGALERREMLLLRLRTDEGIEGLGEAVPLALRGGTPLARVADALRSAAAELVGATFEPGAASPDDQLLNSRLPAPARAALEVAQLDLAAKAAAMPLWKLLGASDARPVRCNASLVAADPPFVAAAAARWAERGFEAFKLKVGVPGDVAQVEAVRAEVGDEARIRVDANGAWSVEAAIARLVAMERFGIELCEQPAPGLEDLAAVRAQTAVPIAADESVAGADDARRAMDLGACQLATVKLSKVGGIGVARTVARILPVYLSSALDGPVGIAAAAHLAQTLPAEGPAARLAHGLATQLLFSEDIAATGCELRGDLLMLPDGPGLGVEIDERARERARV
jgi:o-succinylbenzoate synthase